MNLRVFISHSSRDKIIAQELIHQLEIKGFEILDNERDLDSPDKWTQRILGKIKKSDVVVALMPTTIEDSGFPWTLFEIGVARGAEKRVIPVVISEERELPSTLQHTKLQTIRSKSISAAVNQIEAAIKNEA